VEDLRGIEAVVHLAGLSNDPLGDIDAGLTHEINTVASVRLAELAKEAGVRRFLFSSSCSTYGAAGDAPLDESADFNPVTPYAVSKVEMEEALAELADDAFSPAYLRNATAYGVSSRLRVDLVLNNLVAWAYTTGKVRLLSDGSPWRPIVHIEDISRVFLGLLEAPREVIHDQAFNVGRSEENFRIRDLAAIVAETVPNCELEIAPDAGPDKRTYRVDFSKLESTFPDLDLQWTARRGAQELLDAYRAAGLTFEQFDGPSFKRLGTIQGLVAAGRLDGRLRWA
jgi:nucleoside-diphosphate-sugar epimerase